MSNISKRRTLLQALTVASATGMVWKKPIIDSVILPTHAQTTHSDGWVPDCGTVVQGTASGSIGDNTDTVFRITIPPVEVEELICSVEIDSVEIELDITHDFLTDLTSTISSPDGTTAFLITPSTRGWNSSNIRCLGGTMVVTLDETAAEDINRAFYLSGDDLWENVRDNPACPSTGSNSVRITGAYNTGGGLNNFIGENPFGDWILRITDLEPQDTGTLNSATITINYR